MASRAYAQIDRISGSGSIHTATRAAMASDTLAVASQRSTRRTSSRPTGTLFRHNDRGRRRKGGQCHRPDTLRDRSIGIRSLEATGVLWKHTMFLQFMGQEQRQVTSAISLKTKLLLALGSY